MSHVLERKDTLARITEERDRLQAIMDTGAAVIYLKDRAGRYLFINRRYEELFHISRDAILGKTDFEIFPAEHAAVFRANDLRVAEAGRTLELEEIAPHDDGPHIYLSLKFPMRDGAGEIYGVCGISSDITRFKAIEEDRNLFFHLTLDLLCTADFNGRFLFVSPSWTRTLGWTEEQLTSRPYLEFVHPDDREATVREADHLAHTGYQTISFENRYRCSDGSYRWLLWAAQPMVDRRLIFAAARDITQRKEAEKRLAEHAAQLQQAVDEARRLAEERDRAAASERAAHDQLKKATSHLVQTEKLVSLGQMVAGIAHEINNPLTYVFNNMAVLRRDLTALRELLVRYQDAERRLTPEHADAFQAVRAYAEEIDASYTLASLDGLLSRSRDGLKRIQQIVHDLKHIARSDERGWTHIDLSQGIESVLNVLRIRATQKKVEIQIDLDPVPDLKGNPARIHQVVMNLVHNAIDACAEGGKVTLRTRAAGPAVQIHVLDDGQGIAPEHLGKIFDPFFTTKAPGMGTGLGLSISQAIVEEHGGTIEVESKPGQGSHFTVTLPVAGK